MAAVVPAEIYRHISIPELERGLEEITLQVADQKRHLSDTFRQIHLEVSEREVALVAELDAIPAVIAARIEERKASLEQLTRNREDTERELHANRLNALLQKHLDDIKTEMDRIISEKIDFPHISIHYEKGTVQTILKEKCYIQKTLEFSISKPLPPVWHGVKRGREKDRLLDPTAICIDPASQLIYVVDCSDTQRIQVFTSEGKHHSTLYNPLLDNCSSIEIYRDNIYVSNSSGPYYILKLNKKGDIVKKLNLEEWINGLSINSSKLYTCVWMSPTVLVFDLNLKRKRNISLKAASFNSITTPNDVIVSHQQLFVLFSYFATNYHPHPIQIFQLDGVLIRYFETGNYIKEARYFCLDSKNNILVSDCIDCCVRIFSPDGLLIHSIGREGRKEAGDIWVAFGIAADSQQRAILVDRKEDNMLQAFQY